MSRTIEFAKKLSLDIAMFDICIPYPETPYYKELEAEGRIKTRDWSKYNCHQLIQPLFDHPNLSWSIIVSYYKKAFRQLCLCPLYFIRRFTRSLKHGDLVNNFVYFVKAKW
jgi:radical SAM superfamily enzyme YgiQ (UPF0313 family)